MKAYLVFPAAILADRTSADEILEGLRNGLTEDTKQQAQTNLSTAAADDFLGDIVLRLAKEYGWTGRMISGKLFHLFILKTSNIATNSTHSKRTLTKLVATACSLIKISRTLLKEKTTAEASGKACQSGQVTKTRQDFIATAGTTKGAYGK